MRLIALMLARNESWCIGASLRMALRWCDGAFVLMDRCVDDTYSIVRQVVNENASERIWYEKTSPSELWLEMDHRQRTLEMGRKMGGTHFAVVDADEMLTANLLGFVRGWFETLNRGEILELPRISPVTLDSYWADYHEHATGAITLGFADRADLAWRPRGNEGYHFHGRPPQGSFAASPRDPLGRSREVGGIMHLQYANRRRTEAKSLWYKLNERVRWPNRKTPGELNAIYGAMLDKPRMTRPIPPEWWTEDRKHIEIETGETWHIAECREMVKKYGRGILEGIDLRGLDV